MKTTKKNVIIETTNSRDGCLEQGGVCGLKVAYPIEACERVTGLSAAELAAAEETAAPRGYTEGVTIRDIIEHAVKGQVINKGVAIQ